MLYLYIIRQCRIYIYYIRCNLNFGRKSPITIIFFIKKSRKVWWLLFFVIPLHSLLRQAVYLLVVNKASFFEKIYIDREVVQEASVWFYIKWMGKRNEPINSLSLLLRRRLKTKGTKEKVLFT